MEVNPAAILRLLESIQQGSISSKEGMERLAHLPYEDLEFAKIDHQRTLRTGLPEVIYAAGKTDEQVAEIFLRMAAGGGQVLATRASATAAALVRAKVPEAVFHETARAITLDRSVRNEKAACLAVVCAGTSDLPVAEEAVITAELLGHPVIQVSDVGIAGLHRLLDQLPTLAKARAIIACAGMEGALPTVIAGLVRVPVIAVPTSVGYGASFGGVTALLGMLNSCAPNVAVVNIDNGFGAACFAHTLTQADPALEG